MRTNYPLFILFVLLILWACDDFQLYENVPVGKADLSIIQITPQRGALRGDTLVITGAGYNPVPYLNTIKFVSEMVERPYVNEKGEVTDSITYVITRYTAPVRVVDASAETLRVIVPDDAVTGPVLISYGVDTVISPQPFELVSTLKRPKILAYRPEFGAPGVAMDIHIYGDGQSPNMVVSFGGKLVPVDSTKDLTTYLKVPGIYPGPTDLRIGAVTSSNDTLWSGAVNFGVLPTLANVPFMVATCDYAIVDGRVVDFQTTVKKYNVIKDSVDLQDQGGIVLTEDQKTFYWIHHSGGQNYIVRGIVGGNPHAEITKFGNEPRMRDLAIKDDFLYVCTSRDIRRFRLNAAGRIVRPATILHSQNNVDFRNLKVDGENIFWTDALNKIIYKATLTDNQLNPVTLYSGSQFIEPISTAIDPSNDNIYIADNRKTNEVKIWVGKLSEADATLTEFHISEENNLPIKDLEIDLINGYLYWSHNSASNSKNGIYRKSLTKQNAPAEVVYQFPNPIYFDFKKLN